MKTLSLVEEHLGIIPPSALLQAYIKEKEAQIEYLECLEKNGVLQEVLEAEEKKEKKYNHVQWLKDYHRCFMAGIPLPDRHPLRICEVPSDVWRKQIPEQKLPRFALIRLLDSSRVCLADASTLWRFQTDNILVWYRGKTAQFLKQVTKDLKPQRLKRKFEKAQKRYYVLLSRADSLSREYAGYYTGYLEQCFKEVWMRRARCKTR